MTANFRFSGQHLDNELLSSISRLLGAAGIPNLLWGNYLLTIYGVPAIVDGAAFVVPDACFDTSFSILSNAGFLPCPHGSGCRALISTYRVPAPAHLHINDDLTVSLYRKSDVLLGFPDLELALCSENPHVMSAADNRLPAARLGRGGGRFSPDHSRVHIPSAVKYTESLILLYYRDRERACRAYWKASLTYMRMYVDGTEILDEKDLSDGYRQFYHALKDKPEKAFALGEGLSWDFIDRDLLPLLDG